jgi:DUF971 family protein
MIEEPMPTAITADRTKSEVTIQWSDGHTSIYPFSLLRAACPCASCRGGHENMSSEPAPEVFSMAKEDSPATHMRSLEGVGSYAITIEWEDGHSFGIYNWHYLRALCPCPQCRKEFGYVG